jgi:hypothetical protein
MTVLFSSVTILSFHHLELYNAPPLTRNNGLAINRLKTSSFVPKRCFSMTRLWKTVSSCLHFKPLFSRIRPLRKTCFYTCQMNSSPLKCILANYRRRKNAYVFLMSLLCWLGSRKRGLVLLWMGKLFRQY